MVKKTVAAFVAVIISVQFLLPGYIENDAMYDGEIVRLHVIANSDSDTDQELKLKVRDAVLDVSEKIIKTKDGAEAAEIISENIEIIKQQAKNTVLENGFDYDVKVVCGVFDFPAKSYQNITLPKGKYRAVRVIIGDGAGRNWWCVMFPPLCFTDKTTAYMPDADNVISDSGEFKIKLKLLEILSR